MNRCLIERIVLCGTLLLPAIPAAQAGNGGGMKQTPVLSSTASTPVAVPTAAAAPVTPGADARLAQARQIETFIRSVLPAILSTEYGDDSNLAFLKDKVTYFDALVLQCNASKAGHVETTAVIKKLDPADISIDSVKNEARANVIGNLVSAGASTPTLWVVSVRIHPANAAQAFAVSQIIAGKLP